MLPGRVRAGKPGLSQPARTGLGSCILSRLIYGPARETVAVFASPGAMVTVRCGHV